jgi:ribosomal protein S18 acetylase RimI-like enzyme
MATYPPTQLDPRPVTLESPEFAAIKSWPFPDEPFYVRQIRRLLDTDVAQLVQSRNCTIWAYRDPAASSELVGFGTFCIADFHSGFTDGRPHTYIPVLAANPGVQSRGYGQAIVEHLVEVATVIVRRWPPGLISDKLFLDVYIANERACKLYSEKCGFVTLNPDNPIPDPAENEEPYVVMARSVAVSPAPREDSGQAVG